MLSEIAKKEMLEDAKSQTRRNNFRAGKRYKDNISFDEYLIFLNNIQKILPYNSSDSITKTDFNKL